MAHRRKSGYRSASLRRRRSAAARDEKRGWRYRPGAHRPGHQDSRPQYPCP
jgi:hypothetical protein